MNFALDNADVAKMQLIEKLTKAPIKDVIDDEQWLTIIVAQDRLHQALGKNAENIKRIQDKLRKKVRMVEFNSDASIFLRNLCKPNKIERIDINDDIYCIVAGDYKSRGYIIGKGASTLRNNEAIMKRYFQVKQLTVAQTQEE